MTLYEHYCALCGGLLRSSGVRIRRLPRVAPASETFFHGDMREYMGSGVGQGTTSNLQFVTQSSIQWLNRFCCLGYNENAEGSTKYVVYTDDVTLTYFGFADT
jgi:hypothetical protein